MEQCEQNVFIGGKRGRNLSLKNGARWLQRRVPCTEDFQCTREFQKLKPSSPSTGSDCAIRRAVELGAGIRTGGTPKPRTATSQR
jgi:hypothetical protein